MDKKYIFNKVSEEKTLISIDGDIVVENYRWFGDQTSGYSFRDALSKVTTNELEVHINSYGGHASEGLSIYNQLKEFGKNHKVTTICDGYACSSASIVFMAGHERIMPKTSLLMIHNAWSSVTGNAEEMRKQADDLEKVSNTIAESYLENSTMSKDEIKKLMDEETWITSEEALSYGLATKIEKNEAYNMCDVQILLSQLVSKNKDLEAKLKNKKEPVNSQNDWDEWFNK